MRWLITLLIALAGVAGNLAAEGQPVAPIRVIVGPPQPVPRGPRHVAIGDVNDDGIGDAVVACDAADGVWAIMSDGKGGFAGATFSFALPSVGPVALGYFGSDRRLDLVTTDQSGPTIGCGVLVASACGDGCFRPPKRIDDTVRAAALVVADRDGDGDVDLAAGNGLRGVGDPAAAMDVTIITNLGGNRGFAAGTSFAIADNAWPEDIEAADFDSDGTLDLAVLDTNPAHQAEILVLPNGRPPSMTCTEPCSFAAATGRHPVALVAKDFNGDGAADLAVANSDPALGAHSISILLNRTREVEGVRRGTAEFEVLPPVEVTCPPELAGVAVSCRVTDIGAADFNRDGLNDVVVSVATNAGEDAGEPSDGLLVYYHGLGDGRLARSREALVFPDPMAIAVGDVTGDTLPDVVVAETRSDFITAVRSVLSSATRCGDDGQCWSGYCTDGVCCEVNDCGPGRRCDVGGGEGECRPASPTDPTPTARAVCVGDCDGDKAITVDEVVAVVAIAVGEAEPSACPAIGRDGAFGVTVDDVVAAIANALRGCSLLASR